MRICLPAKVGRCLSLVATIIATAAVLLQQAQAGDNTLAPIADYFQETWTTRDGLPHNTINAIAQTADGYLWLATWEGPARFNGREFDVHDQASAIGLPDAGVKALLAEADGSLLVGGARGGIARTHDGQWQGIPPTQGVVARLYRDRHSRLWAGTEGTGLLRIDSDGGRVHYDLQDGLLGRGVTGIAEDSDGRLWFGTTGGLMWLDGDRPVPVASETGLAGIPVSTLHLAADGSLLVGTDRGVHRSRADGTFEALLTGHEPVQVSQLLGEADGSIWVGTVNDGLLRISALGVEHMGMQEGLPNTRVLALLRDRENSLWVGTNGGLVRLRDSPMVSHTRARGPPDDYVRAVLEHSDGGLWVGTSKGLARFGEHGAQHIGTGTELAAQSVLSLAEARNGELWIGTFADGAWRLREGRVQQRIGRHDGLPSNEVRAILETRSGELWIGTALGLTRIDQQGSHRVSVADGLPGDFIVSLMESATGEVWIGTGSGAAVYANGQLRALPLHQADNASYAFAFLEDAETLNVWIATDRGLIRYRRSDASLNAVGRRAGLRFEKLFSITLDDDGYFWLSGNRGVMRISKRDAEAVADGARDELEVESFGESDGMASSQCNGGSSPAATRRRDGSVWFATSVGVAAVQPWRLAHFAEQPPPVVIERIAADGRDLMLEDGLRLPPGSNRLEIEFAGLGFVVPERIRYRYRLDGFDDQWIERGNQTFAELTNLPPGDYQFRVAAAYSRGNWGNDEARFSFSVDSHWWQRIELQITAALATLALLFAALRLRVRQIEHRAQQLRALVDSRTADLNRQTQLLLAADTERSALLERLRRQSEAFERQAREDALTGLSNRRAFDEQVSAAFAQARQGDRPLCLAIIDIDNFKRINDDHSHSVGDEALKAVASCLRACLREGESLSRWGGEEFAVLLTDTTLHQALAIAERIRLAIAKLDCSAIAAGLAVTVSIGVAADDGAGNHEKLLTRADAALYRAKAQGRNRVVGGVP